ncbi:MAG: 50S ribosomal protein L6 [Candidatus Woesearchaeota archaeon]|nr:50S ribosomal protein L6 [Candidatus Woesearchaeota archaeon]
MKRGAIEAIIEIPAGVDAKLTDDILTLKSGKNEASKKLASEKIKLVLEGNKLKLTTKKSSKKEKKLVGSFRAHIKNLIEGIREPHVYKLKICSGHFPMNVSIAGSDLTVKNFLGEKIPRKLKLKKGASVKIEGSEITIESANKELAGQAAADIEQLTKRPNYDPRIFQDGIYIIIKDGKEVK